MRNKTLLRGLFLATLALGFGLNALRYPIGSLAHAGPGFFALMVSGVLFVLALIQIARAPRNRALAVQFRWPAIASLIASLLVFYLATIRLNMAVGIVALVFIASLARPPYLWKRSLKVSAGLIAIAYAMQTLLGLNLNLY